MAKGLCVKVTISESGTGVVLERRLVYAEGARAGGLQLIHPQQLADVIVDKLERDFETKEI